MAQFEAVKTWGPFPSSKRGAKPYTVQLNTTGVLSCNCLGWAVRKKDKYTGEMLVRDCKHTKLVISSDRLAVKAIGQYLFVQDARLEQAKKRFAPAVRPTARPTQPTKRTPQEIFAGLVAEYEAAIDKMAQLDPLAMIELAPAVALAKFKVESYMVLLEQHGIDGTAAFESAQAKAGRILES